MNRRDFLKAMSAAGMSAFAPSSMMSMYKSANAAIKYSSLTITAPLVMPQVINIFLYGGPSELAGNLTNIADIEVNSENSYATAFDPGILDFQNVPGGLITPSGFWSGAGGDDMQFMVDQGYMSVYRTLMKRIDTTRSHRESILLSHKGSLDIEVAGGMGSKLAAVLIKHRSLYENTAASLADGSAIVDLENMFLPFVSFEGKSTIFAPEPNVSVPLLMRGITLDENFNNPFLRGNDADKDALSDIAAKRVSASNKARYKGVADSFEVREFLEAKMQGLTPAANVQANQDGTGGALPSITGFADSGLDAASIGLLDGDQLVYPVNNRYTDRIRAAVTLALKNPSTLFISVGGGLGGWDDHNNGTTNYPGRMSDLMAVMKAAMLHIKYSATAATLGDGINPGPPRTTSSNIAINMFGDFGRLVNLNRPQGGWDHGNNQNLYTFGFDDTDAASPRPSGALGKVVGKTVWNGTSKDNNQVTIPAPGSYEAEPMSVASTMFSYFGVQNPQILTADAMLNPAGVPAIDETTVADPDLPLF